MREQPKTVERTVGPYEIIREIGRGGTAVVYLARQTVLERDVALKELGTLHAQEPQIAKRFLHESKLTSSLNHPNIVTVYQYLVHEGVPFIAMEYVPCGSLRRHVGRLTLAQFAGVMEGILAGLSHAESHGIVHRDLKPENVLVTADGRVKITDFGIAKAIQQAASIAFMTATAMMVGTPHYMAPEQAMGRELGPWTDLYSVGIIAWEYMVGSVPFHEIAEPMAILMRQVTDTIPSAAEINPDVELDLSAWIDRLLIKDPAKRTSSAVLAWEELEEIVAGKLGALWRRAARLATSADPAELPAITPAPFESKGARRPSPGLEKGSSAPGSAAGSDPVGRHGSVVLADDDALLREGIASLLERAGFEIAGQAGDAPQLLELVRRRQPELVLVDIRMPPTHTTEGLDAARQIRGEFPNIGVVVLSAYVEVDDAMKLLESGERIGYLLKSRVTDVEGFVETLELIAKGGSVVDPAVVQEVVGARRQHDPLAELTAREREVLALMAEGCSNAGIARRLWVTEGTVEKHVRSILAKLPLPATDDHHRRVLAVLEYLNSR